MYKGSFQRFRSRFCRARYKISWEKLLSQASGLVFSWGIACALLLIGVGGLIAAALYGPPKGALILFCGMLGVGTGVIIGRHQAFMLRVPAQEMLWKVSVEKLLTEQVRQPEAAS